MNLLAAKVIRQNRKKKFSIERMAVRPGFL